MKWDTRYLSGTYHCTHCTLPCRHPGPSVRSESPDDLRALPHINGIGEAMECSPRVRRSAGGSPACRDQVTALLRGARYRPTDVPACCTSTRPLLRIGEATQRSRESGSWLLSPFQSRPRASNSVSGASRG